MHDRSDGCLLIVLSFGGTLFLTFFVFAASFGDHPPETHSSVPAGLGWACLGSWVFSIGVVIVEAVRDQRRGGK